MDEVMRRHCREAAENLLAGRRRAYGTTHPMVPTNAAQYGHLDMTAYDDFSARMRRHGFRFVADMAQPTLTNTPDSFFLPVMMRSMTSADGHMSAAHWQAKARLSRQLRALAKGMLNLRPVVSLKGFVRGMKIRNCVDLATEFDDGAFICTSNAQLAALVSTPPSLMQRYHPYGTPPEVLLEDHLRRVQDYLQANPDVRPLILGTADQIAQSSQRLHVAKCAWHEQNGWITKEEIFRHGRANPPEVNEGVFEELQRILAEERAAGAKV
jgi:hypothetical protein